MSRIIDPAGQAGWPWTSPADYTFKEGKLVGQQVVIRRSGNLIEVSPDGSSALPRDVRDLLEPHLTYTYQEFLRGLDRYDPATGYDRGPVRFEERRIYRYDGSGRFCCGIGFMGKIRRLLDGVGCKVSVLNCDPPHPRKNRFTESWDNVVNTVSFRPMQDECLVQIAANEYGIIQAPTGFGKGMIITMVCLLYPNAKIHVVTPSKDLVSKTVRALTRFIPNVGQVGIGKKRVERVTVFSADSLHLSDGDADIVLADEIHELAAPSYSEALARYRFSRNFGFSATPEGRMDGADAKLESLFGEKIFELSYPKAVELGLVVPIVVEWLDIRMQHNPCEGKKDTAKKRWGIWRNEERNQILADRILQIDPDEQVLVLVETIEHLMFLRAMLPGFVACYSEQGLKPQDVAMYRKWGLMGEDEEPLTTKEREQLRLDFEAGKIKKAIATKVWATGVDFEQLAVLVRADAQASTIMDTQAPGRVSRVNTAGQKPFGLVIDCMDHFDDGFRRKSMSRRRSYDRNEWAQIVPKRRRG